MATTPAWRFLGTPWTEPSRRPPCSPRVSPLPCHPSCSKSLPPRHQVPGKPWIGKRVAVRTTMSLWSSPVSLVILLYILWISAAVRAYIPATPTNDTDTAIQNGLNVTDSSYLITRWYSNDGYILPPLCNSCLWLGFSILTHPWLYVGTTSRPVLVSLMSWWGQGPMASPGWVAAPSDALPSH